MLCFVVAALLACGCVVLLLVPYVGEAYRPFDSTDASVVDVGVLELEVQPVGYLREGSSDSLVTPAVVANVGVAPDWEVVLQGRNVVALDGTVESEDTELVDTGAFLKGVLSEGSLQGAPGPSVATELGAVLPTSNEGSGVGATLVAILSQQWPLATVHVNVAPIWSRDDHFELFAGAIGEGPEAWLVRPVAEVFVEKQFGGPARRVGPRRRDLARHRRPLAGPGVSACRGGRRGDQRGPRRLHVGMARLLVLMELG